MNALAPFHKYDGVKTCHIFRNPSPARRFQMAAAKPVTNMYPFINYIGLAHRKVAQVCHTYVRNSNGYPTFLGSRNSRALSLTLILSRVSESRKFNMRLPNRRYIYPDSYTKYSQNISSYDTLKQHSNGYHDVCWHHKLNGAIGDVVPWPGV